MKLSKCPKCDSSLQERWVEGRMLKQFCSNESEECFWSGEPYIPQTKKISSTVSIGIDEFTGWRYEVFDKYGYIAISSATHNSKSEAIKEMIEVLTPRKGYNDPRAPLTAVLVKIPATVKIRGKKFKFKNGKII